MYICIHIYITYIRTYIPHNYVEDPVVKITKATGGCGNVSVSWNATGNNYVCRVRVFNVTLSFLSMDMMVFESARTTSYRRSHSFTGLPYDTLFNITVIGNNVLGALSDFAITSVRTMAFKGAYVHTYQYSCIYILYYIRMYLMFG